jgi:lipoprotein-releasing system permease protein
MKYELLIGLRYTRAQPREGAANRFISFIALISMAGLALGVAALIVVLSVMNGFQKELRERILGVVSHVQVSSESGELADWAKVMQGVARHPRVKAAAPYVQAQGMLSFDGQVRGVMVRGILPEAEDKVADFARYMKSGKLDAVAARRIRHRARQRTRPRPARQGRRQGDAAGAAGLVTPAAILPRVKQFRVVGIFEAGMFEFDSGLALVHMTDAQKLYRMDERVSGVRLKIDDLFAAPQVGRELLRYLDMDAWISDWTRSHANFFRAVEIEKRMMFLILLLIVAVAAFNIVSTLVMAVTDKRADIAILRTLGRQPAQHHGHLHRPGHADRRGRPGRRHRRRRGAGAQHRRRGAGAGAPAGLAVPGQGRVLHQRTAFRPALVGCRHHQRGVLRPHAAGDPVSELARIAHATGGGVAL